MQSMRSHTHPEQAMSQDIVHEGRYSKCQAQMIEIWSKQIHKPPSLVPQVEARSQSGIVFLHTFLTWLHP